MILSYTETVKQWHSYTVYIFRAAEVLQCHLCVNCDRFSWSSYASQQELQVVAPHKLWLTICPRQFSHLPTSEITFEIPGENYLWHHFDVDFTALSGLLTCDLSKRAQLCLGQNMIRWQAKSLPRRKRLWKMWTNWRFDDGFKFKSSDHITGGSKLTDWTLLTSKIPTESDGEEFRQKTDTKNQWSCYKINSLLM